MACVAGPLPKEPGDARGLIAGISVHEIALVMSAFIDGQADLLRSIGTDFMALVSTGQVTPRIKRTIPLSDVVAALNAREGGSGGKTVYQTALAFTKPIIVLGSSGNVGKATLAALSAAGVPATAGVRDASPDNPKNAPLLAMSGISLAQADMSKPETLAPAIAEGSTVFVATPGHIDRTALTQAAVQAAVAAKAGHIVVVSLPVVTVAKSTIFGDQFKSIEAAVKSSGIPFTLVRLPMFMDNVLGQPIKDMSSVFMPVVADQDMSSISVRDIGCGVANVLQTPEKYAGRTLNLAGVTTNFTATVAAYSKVLGRTINYTQVPPEAAKASMMGAGWPEWQVDGVLELMALVNEKDPSGLIPKADDNTFEVLGRPAESPEAFIETFKAELLTFKVIPAQKWVLAKPAGATLAVGQEMPKGGYPKITLEHFKMQTERIDVGSLKDGEVLIEHVVLTVDPYVVAFLMGPDKVGSTVVAGGVGKVIASNAPEWKAGELAVAWSNAGASTHSIQEASNLKRYAFDGKVPPSAALGVLGMPGATAYFAVKGVLGGDLSGQTIVVSAAGGAVGSIAGQIAKALGAKAVIGIAGGAAKCARCIEKFGFDAMIDYRAKAYSDLPDHVDGYIDNVGGEAAREVKKRMKDQGRVAKVGNIGGDEIGDDKDNDSRLQVTIFQVMSYAEQWDEAFKFLAPLIEAGKLRFEETERKGLDQFPAAFVDLMGGKNNGKMLVTLKDGYSSSTK